MNRYALLLVLAGSMSISHQGLGAEVSACVQASIDRQIPDPPLDPDGGVDFSLIAYRAAEECSAGGKPMPEIGQTMLATTDAYTDHLAELETRLKPQSDVLKKQWWECLENSASKLANRTSDDAKEVARAVINVCHEEEEELIDFHKKNKDMPFFAHAFVPKVEDSVAGQLTSDIILARAKLPTHR